MHDIKITNKVDGNEIANGFIITIGCRSYVAMDIDEAMKEVTRYMKEPEKVEREYREKYNVKFENGSRLVMVGDSTEFIKGYWDRMNAQVTNGMGVEEFITGRKVEDET